MVCIGIVDAIVSIVFIFGMLYIAFAPIDMKTQYEIMTTIDGDYAVLSEYDGNILVAPIDMSKDAHEAVFYTNKYSFKSRTDGVFKNIVFTRPPEIVSE